MDSTSIITQVNKEDEALEVSNSYTHEKRKLMQGSMHCTFCWRATIELGFRSKVFDRFENVDGIRFIQ